MTKRELMQVRSLRDEIKLMEAERTRLNELLTEHVPPTTVKGSSPDYPYTMHTIVMDGGVRERAGGDSDALRSRRNNLASKITARKLAYSRTYEKVEQWIASIPDSRTRQVFRLKYIEGKTFQQIANATGNCITEDAVRKRHDRYLKKFL